MLDGIARDVQKQADWIDDLLKKLRKAAGEKFDLRGCNFRGLDLRELDVSGGLDLSNAYLRQADLRGLNLSKCRLEGASLHAAHVSGVLFPVELEPAEIEMSVRIGTRMRYRP